MIPQIQEINFPSYATLHQATANFVRMGDRTISTQVRIDGDVTPTFDGWELSLNGERFILPIKEPQASKDASSRNALVDLNFQSLAIYQTKRYFFFETATVASGTVMADKYKASVRLNLTDFCALMNQVLQYYFGGDILVDLNPSVEDPGVALMEINYSYIWDVIIKFYEVYGVAWELVYDSANSRYLFKVGYPSAVIDDHDFEYGYLGGLSRFERQVQDENIYNILLGRGGEKNMPYRYFKIEDPENPDWSADPDAIPELADVYFDRLRDVNFRWYVRGWMHNPSRDTSGDEAWDPGHVFPTYTITSDSPYYWAYQKGLTDESFDPVEYVKDDESITKYGERWGALDDNDEIYPTIQGIYRGTIGRVDEVVAVSTITTDDVDATAVDDAIRKSIEGVTGRTTGALAAHSSITSVIRGSNFTIQDGMSGNLMHTGWYAIPDRGRTTAGIAANIQVRSDRSFVHVYDASTNEEVPSAGIPAGDYYYTLEVCVENNNDSAVSSIAFGNNGLYIEESSLTTEAWKPTFDIWIKNIFLEYQQESGETDEEYAERVWSRILGDHLGQEAKVVFSDGPMSISEDYEFLIAEYPVVDRSKTTLDGYRSEWKITLFKSNAELEATGLYIPNATTGGQPVAGNHFFFTGIDMPHFYVEAGEERVNEYKTANLYNAADINPTWVVNLDKVRINSLEDEEAATLFSRIKVGTEVRIRDRRFTGDEHVRLYVQSMTYTWNEPTDDNPYLHPDVEIILSDKIETGGSVVQQMQGDIEILKSVTVKTTEMDGVVTRIVTPKFMRKTGEDELSYSPTRFASLVASKDFQPGGVGGTGWGLYRDNSKSYQNLPEEPQSQQRSLMRAPALRDDPTPEPEPEPASPGESVFEVDRLIVRHDMEVNNLVVHQQTYVGGMQINSAAAIECVQVVETQDSYICYFDQKQGTVVNLFHVGDIAKGHVFTPSQGDLRFYKMIVTATDVDSITLAKAGKYGSGAPAVGDNIIQYGSVSDPDRQYVIIKDVVGGGYEKMLSGLTSTSSEGDEYFFAGIDPDDDPSVLYLKDSAGNFITDSAGNKLTVTGGRQPKFFVGDENSHIKYSRLDKTFYVKGALVVSPAGVEFPVPCWRGEYSSIGTYYYGDVVVYNGRAWMHYGKTPTTGVAPSSGDVWDIYSDKGADGAPGRIYELRPSVTQVKKDQNGYYSVQSVTCKRIKHIGLDFEETSDGTLTYSLDGGTEQAYTGAISSSLFTSTLVFIMRIGQDVVAMSTVSMVEDGAEGSPGSQGETGRTIRFGEWDASTEYFGQNDDTPGLLYIDAVVYNYHTYLCLRSHNSSGSDPKIPPQNISGSNPYWLLADERQFVAAKAMVVDQAFIDSLAVKRLTSDTGAGTGYTQIREGKAEFYTDGRAATTAIHSGQLGTNAGGTTVNWAVGTSANCNQASGTVTLANPSTSPLNVTENNNFLSIPQITLVCQDSLPDIEYDLYISNGTTRFSLIAASITQGGTLTLGARNISLPAGNGYGLYLDYVVNEGTGFTYATTSPWTLYLGAFTVEIAQNGMKALFQGEGIKTTSSGAKVIQNSVEYDMIGGSGGIKRIAFVTNYPSPEEQGVLYIKTSSS